MLARDALLCHFRKWMYHGGKGGCAILSLLSTLGIAQEEFGLMKGVASLIRQVAVLIRQVYYVQ